MRDCAPDGMSLSELLARVKETSAAAASAATSPLVHYLTASSNSDKKANPHLCLGMGLTQISERIWSILAFPLPGASLNYLLPPRQMMPFSWQLKGGQTWPEGNAMVESIPLGTWLLGKEKDRPVSWRAGGQGLQRTQRFITPWYFRAESGALGDLRWDFRWDFASSLNTRHSPGRTKGPAKQGLTAIFKVPIRKPEITTWLEPLHPPRINHTLGGQNFTFSVS